MELIMVELKFEGSYKDFLSFLNGMGERTKEALQVVSFSATGEFIKTENERASLALKDFIGSDKPILQAIKAVRTATGWALKDAQKFVEREMACKITDGTCDATRLLNKD